MKGSRAERVTAVLSPGQEYDFKILRLEPEQRKISLSYRAAQKQVGAAGDGDVPVVEVIAEGHDRRRDHGQAAVVVLGDSSGRRRQAFLQAKGRGLKRLTQGRFRK